VEAIEAQGWPANPNNSSVALRQVQSALADCDRAEFLLNRMEETANQNPAFAPSAMQAARVLENAKRRLERAQKRQESSKERPQPGSYDEAMRQLELACRDGAIPVTGDLVVKSAGGLAPQRGCEIPAAEIREISVAKRVIVTDRGTFINVRLRTEHVDGIWPPPPDNAAASSVEAPAISAAAPPARGSQRIIVNAMKRYLTGERAAGRHANMDRAVSSIKAQFPRASRRQLREIYRAEVQQPRGRPRKNRR